MQPLQEDKKQNMLGVKELTPVLRFLPFFLLLFFAFSFLYHDDFSFNQDLGMHLALGKIIWNTHTIPSINLFSYTNPDFLFINHHWFFELTAYFFSRFFGLQSLLLLRTVVLLACVGITLIILRKTKSALWFPVTFIFLHLLRERTDIRPEMISFLLTAITYYLLDRFTNKLDRWIFLLPLISLIWVNSHIYFPVGICLQLIFLGDFFFEVIVKKDKKKMLKKQLIILSFVTVLSIIACLFNPNGLRGAMYPFTVFTNYGVTITENQTIFTLERIHFINQDFLFFYLAGFIVLTAIYLSFWRTRFSFRDIALALLGLALAFQSIRGFPYLFFVSLPASFALVNVTKPAVWIKTLTIVTGVILVIESLYYLNGIYYRNTYEPFVSSLVIEQNEKAAVDFLLLHDFPQPIFNNFDTGSYLIYRAYPKYKVFVDERPEAYPASFFTNTYLPMQENYDRFKQEEKKWGFQTILFAITDQNPRALTFLNAVTRDPEWKIVYLDGYMMILTRTNIQQQMKLPFISLAKLPMNYFHYATDVPYTNLSTFLFNLHYVTEAKVIDEKALRINPNSLAANKAMAYILYTEKAATADIDSYYAKTTGWVFW